MKEGEPISYYDFEFEQYTVNKKILREMLLDEIILANSKEARAYNKQLRQMHPEGILEKIYMREKTEETKKSDHAKSPPPVPVQPSTYVMPIQNTQSMLGGPQTHVTNNRSRSKVGSGFTGSMVQPPKNPGVP